MITVGTGRAEYGGQMRIVVRHRVHDEPVDPGAMHGGHIVAAGTGRHQV